MVMFFGRKEMNSHIFSSSLRGEMSIKYKQNSETLIEIWTKNKGVMNVQNFTLFHELFHETSMQIIELLS